MNRSMSRWMGVVIVLQIMIVGALWSGPVLPRAEAQIPDPGAQRERQLDELRALNSKMDKLLDLLESGKLQVNVVVPEKK